MQNFVLFLIKTDKTKENRIQNLEERVEEIKFGVICSRGWVLIFLLYVWKIEKFFQIFKANLMIMQ